MPENIKKLPKSQIEIQMSVPSADLEKFLDSAAEELSKNLKIAGFRPGKAPRNIVEQHVGAEKVLAHGAEKAINKSFVDFAVKNKIESIGEPQITITKIARGNDLEYKAVVSVLPQISLGNYRKLAQSTNKSLDEKIKPAEIEKELEYLQKSRAKLITVSRGAKVGDRVEIDFDVLVEGKEIEGGKSKSHPLTIGESYFIPGFEDNLTGMKEGEIKEFNLDFPADYHKKELTGKPAKFKVKMVLVQEKQLPEINDEFAKSLGNFQALANLKENILEGMKSEQKKKNEDKWRQAVIEKIIAEAEVEIPDVLIEHELDKMMAELEQHISGMGMKIDDYLVSIKKSSEDMRKDWKENAEKRVKSSLALKEIARLENIAPEQSEIESEINKTLAHFKSHANLEKNVDLASLYNYTKGVLSNEKVFNFLESL